MTHMANISYVAPHIVGVNHEYTAPVTNKGMGARLKVRLTIRIVYLFNKYLHATLSNLGLCPSTA
jgi:hypothetical protein